MTSNSVDMDRLLTLEMHIIKGSKEVVEKELTKSFSCDPELRPEDLVWKSYKTSILHMAAGAGQLEVISCILEKDGNLLYYRNDKGDLPIHVALKAGQKAAVLQLLQEEKQVLDKGESSKHQLEITNKEGNTALHIALDNRFEELATTLFNECPQTFYHLNAKGICPLYLAIKSEYFGLANLMLDHQVPNPVQVQDALKSRSSVVHAAIIAKNQDMLKTLINKYPQLKYSLDENGRTILSIAAQTGFIDGVEYLLNERPELACQQDEDGSYPIHQACSGGNLPVIQKFFTHITNMECSLNQQNQNILHIAAMNGKDNVVKYVLKQPRNKTEGLINMKDKDGNTPLHLATMGKHPKVVYTLTTDKRVQKHLQNNQGLTALDLAERSREEPSFEKRLTWTALLYANVPRSVPVPTGKTINSTMTTQYKQRVDTLLLVCTLVATVTFAATFTMPGGYKILSKQQEGMATLAHKHAFQVFVITNTIAMYSSMFSAVTLIWAQLDDVNLSILSLNFALPSLGIALTMMPVAFMTGSYVVLHTMCNWLAIAVLILGGGFLVGALAFFVPLCSPVSPAKSKFMRCLDYMLFKMMLLGCSRS